MKVIIPAAGQGTRLRPLTDDRPKCMVELEGKPIIEHQLEVFKEKGIDDVNVITGYMEEKIDYPGIKKFRNPDYETTNMVSSIFCAEEVMDDDLIISYGDIVYNGEVLEKLLSSQAPISVVVDKNWRECWEARMDDPLSDAETLKIDESGNIKELGKKPKSYDDIEGQYIGLMKFSGEAIKDIKKYYHSLDKNAEYDGKDFDNMYMTSFLQQIADNLMPLTPVYINNGWLEIDAPEDLDYYKFVKKNNNISNV
ncbi:phosphocholine cytidylyltransferase family protein [Patescibacteria group bacterium]|nr:phosphocholine cytidylyltransferase family protein [Patescibacteria group bacterium]MBU1963973.1 phosphocholine cytidylyltransferase family protein [Patescibacteria group bacterium]